LSRRSSKNEDGNLHLKKSSLRRTGELYSNQPEFLIPSAKLVLTTNPALVIQMEIVCVNGRFNMLGCNWRGENTHHAALNFYPIFIPLFETKVSGVSVQEKGFKGSGFTVQG
jgi:hypothetical protein